jgi:AcrR family transcriptional regulator
MARAALSRSAVIDAAVRLADDYGLSALTMRRLGAELGVEAMSLYNHIADKEDLHRGLVDRVWAQVDLALDDSDWRSALHRLCGSAYRAMVAHPWFLSLPVTYGGQQRLAVIDATLAHVKGSGQAADAAFHVLHVLDGFVAGYAWQEVGYADLVTTGDEGAKLLEFIDADRLPHLMEHARQHVEAVPPGDGFGIGLDMLLDSLDSRVP